MVNIWEIKVTTPPERGWVKIKGFTDKQMYAIRQQAALEGKEDLRGYHMMLKSRYDVEHPEGWDYYDVIKAFYGQ